MSEKTEKDTEKDTKNARPSTALSLLIASFIFCKCAEITAIADWNWWAVLIPIYVYIFTRILDEWS